MLGVGGTSSKGGTVIVPPLGGTKKIPSGGETNNIEKAVAACPKTKLVYFIYIGGILAASSSEITPMNMSYRNIMI